VTLLIDTSVWSLAFRRDGDSDASTVVALRAALAGGESIVTTGLILQELLQGFAGPRARKEIVERFTATDDCPGLTGLPRRRRASQSLSPFGCSDVQIGTIDALLAQLCIRHDLTLLTTDGVFTLAAKHSVLRVWKPSK
jgi:predicted nucleic acid-binding protein